MLENILFAVGFLIVWLFLAPCSPLSIWRSGSCAWKPKAPADDTKPAEKP